MTSADATPEGFERHDLAEYLVRQRWFNGTPDTSTVAHVRPLGWLSDPLGGVGVRFELVTVVQHGNSVTYNVPLSYRRDLDEALAYGLVGVEQWAEGEFYVYDAVHDPEARSIIMRGFVETPTGAGVGYAHLDDPAAIPYAPSVVLSVDQSNTCLVVDDSVMLKLFRKLDPGRNPEIEVLQALTLQGSQDVPALHGWISVQEPACDLAMLAAFQRTATGGWDSARASVRDLLAEDELAAEDAGGDFAAESERLGETTAHVHAQMGELLAQEQLDRVGVESLVARLRDRLDEALAVVPTLSELADAIRQRYDAVVDHAPVRVQRVHGDLHLGQALRTTQGWALIDFEGEPAKPLSDRVRLDSPLRDVAGMLRSLDYAAHSVLLQTGVDDPASRAHAGQWVERNRVAFLRGYGFDASPASAALLAAYELDKAVYEVVYELQHRPEWVEIPDRAVERLVR